METAADEVHREAGVELQEDAAETEEEVASRASEAEPK